MGSAITNDEITLRKTVSSTGDRLKATYRLDPTDTDTGRVQLVERFSKSVGRDAISFSSPPNGQWELRAENEVAFVGEFYDGQPIELSLQVFSATLTPDDFESEVTATTDDRQMAHPWTDGSGTPPRENGHIGNQQSTETTETPAIGIVGTTDNIAAVAQTTVRASEFNVPVFVAVTSEHRLVAQVVEQLGATVIRLDIGDRDLSEFSTAILSAAENRSCPGIIFHGACEEAMAIEASIEQFRASPDPITEPVLESEQTDVLVGLPAYNEGDTVGTVIEQASEHADTVLVVDDGSTDCTAQRARETDATVIQHERNGGYGKALKTIFSEADRRDVDSLVILDADNQHDTSDIPRLVEKHRESHADIVIGNRFGQSTETDVPLYRRVGLYVITGLTNLSIGSLQRESRITDAQSGFRCYSAAAVSALAENAAEIDDRMSASVDILSIANSAGLRITEVPTTITYDVSNASTQNPVTHGLTIVQRLLRTFERKRPLTTFGLPGIFLVLIGVFVWLWSGSAPDLFTTVGATLVAALCVLFGALSSVLSVVQHSLNTSLKGGP